MNQINSSTNECPRCKGTNTFWDDSQADPDNDGAYFYMYCEDCESHYGVHMIYDRTTWEDD